MTLQTRRRIAAVAGILLGLKSLLTALAVVSDQMTPAYVVLPWLLTYNGVVGALTIPIAFGIWRGCNKACRVAKFVAAAHGAILLALVVLHFTGADAAWQSMAAMTFRTTLWSGIALAIRGTCKASEETA